jgi:hypothetical protein
MEGRSAQRLTPQVLTTVGRQIQKGSDHFCLPVGRWEYWVLGMGGWVDQNASHQPGPCVYPLAQLIVGMWRMPHFRLIPTGWRFADAVSNRVVVRVSSLFARFGLARLM